ncbi:radical SAM protein [Desulfofundulus sp. TPOSR]|jgi:radical SAM superfamily enzyme YgiQ (UPF0313 family)|uniref:radical SAM protein n=1 Tax=Desulfofundulus sp. TPOSR TaxID=2714340 RepID=UPI00140BD454|nr:radical SAM protein [Desulfofundulus sp. TPOSR]NHM27514.1 radical SAM protein [Desulfofundulus sp. TPOSR]
MLPAILQHGKGYHEMGPIRPPSEGKDRSLLLRVTRNCPWNRCEFCRTYKNKTYSLRSVEEIKADIDTVKALAGEIKATSWRLGFRGDIRQEVVTTFINENPALYSSAYNDPGTVERRLESLANVVHWLSSGARTVFLQDANAPQIRTADLVEILHYLKVNFPTIERITSYARSKTIARKSQEDLKRLREAGLSRLHIGLESGCDEVLACIQKGTTADEHILAGKKTKEAGIELSEYYMPGLGGKKWSKKHALESARVLNEIDPDFIRLRTLVPRLGTPLYDRIQAGEFEPLTEDEVVEEIALFVEHLDCHAYLASDQMCNLLWEVEGQLPGDKPAILQTIYDYLQKPLHERLKIQLERRLSSYLFIAGHLNRDLAAGVEAAWDAVNRGSPDAPGKVQKVLDAVKPAFI